MFKVKSDHNYIDLFEGIIIGGSLVAAATFLFGTKKGKALQKELVHQYKKFGHVSKDVRHKLEKALEAHTAKGTKSAAKAKPRKTVKKTVKRAKRKTTAAKKRA